MVRDKQEYGLERAIATPECFHHREVLAQWMFEHSFATGHGNKFEDLLKELSWQVEELRRAVAESRSQSQQLQRATPDTAPMGAQRAATGSPKPAHCGCDEYPECTHMLYWYEGFKVGKEQK